MKPNEKNRRIRSAQRHALTLRPLDQVAAAGVCGFNLGLVTYWLVVLAVDGGMGSYLHEAPREGTCTPPFQLRAAGCEWLRVTPANRIWPAVIVLSAITIWLLLAYKRKSVTGIVVVGAMSVLGGIWTQYSFVTFALGLLIAFRAQSNLSLK